MVKAIEIENLPEETGEEIVLRNNDDGTICSKILGSTAKEIEVVTTVVSVSAVQAKQFKEDLNEVDQNADSKTDHDDTTEAETLSVENNGEDEEEKEEEKGKDDKSKGSDQKIELEDRDFDKNPTVLYALVQKKLWKETMARAKKSPGEARAFICRREKDGRVRWRLLPLHAAIVFKAPEEVVETLLTAFPKAAEAKDDQGMLPLHLAFRNGASEAAVNLLLLAYPQSVDIPDRKGRVPLTLAKAASSPNCEVYIKALEKGPSHYAVTSLACARARIMAEQNAIFEAKLVQARASHQSVLNEVEADAGMKQQEIHDGLLEKEKELNKLHETSQVLVDHVTSLEAQINTRSDTERFLATKIAKLEEKLRESEILKDERESFLASKISEVEENITERQRLKDERESFFEDERNMFMKEKDNLLAQIDEVQTTLSMTREKLANSLDAIVRKEEDWDIEGKELEEKCRKTEVEWANAQGNCAILEAQLKKRMENEHLLASQVGNLASRLAECSHELNENETKYTQEITELEEEQASLSKTVEDLTQRLQHVSVVMQNTHKQQMMIVDDAIGHEEIMADCMETHAKMVSESIQQERQLRQAREEMMKLLEQSFDEADKKRRHLMHSITHQGKNLCSMIKTRGNMLACVQLATSNVTSVLENDLAGIEPHAEEEIESNDKDKDEGGKLDKFTETLEKDEEILEEKAEHDVVDDEQQQFSVVSDEVEEIVVEEVQSPKKHVLQENSVVVQMENEIPTEERTEFDEGRNTLNGGTTDRVTAE